MSARELSRRQRDAMCGGHSYAHGDLRTLRSLERLGWVREPYRQPNELIRDRAPWRAELTPKGWRAQETIAKGGNPFTGRLPMTDGFSPEQRRRARIGL